MRKNTLDHNRPGQEDHQTEPGAEHIANWQRQALQPFVEKLCERNPSLAQEISKELEGVTGPPTQKSQVSWLDDHDKEPDSPYRYGYEARTLNQAETDILMSYRDAAPQLDDAQKEHLASTLMEAMSHRANQTFSEHFRDQTDHAANHKDAVIPDRESFNTLMDTAGDYYRTTLSNTEGLLKSSIKTFEDPMILGRAVDLLRYIEKDMEGTAAQGSMPQHLDLDNVMDDFTEAYTRRGDQLAASLEQDFKDTFPDQPLNPEHPAFIQHFREKTKDYLTGDIDNVADHFALDHAFKTSSGPASGSPQEMQERTEQIRENIHQSLTNPAI